MRCQDAEELGLAIKRRYDRSLQRRGLARADRRRAEAEVAERLDRLLA